MDSYRAEVASIGKSVLIKGELSGSEDLYLDGEVEGSVDLHDHSLIVGPNGRVRANIHARDVVIHGKVDGNVYGNERVELKKSAILMGDISTQRIVIEDGAYFKGAIDITKKEGGKSESRRESASAGSAAVGSYSASAGSSASAAAPPRPLKMLEKMSRKLGPPPFGRLPPAAPSRKSLKSKPEKSTGMPCPAPVRKPPGKPPPCVARA